MSAGLLCPGQGAQTVGMGVSWTQQSPAAAEVFRRCSEALGFDLLELCAAGPAERLVRTDVCQPAILATSAACLAALEEQGRVDRGRCSVALGLSLGEYTALYAAGVLELEDAVRLVRLRGSAMQEASDDPPSGMTSLVGADRETAQEVCDEATASGGVCVVANLNAPGQVVISGDREALARAEAAATAHGIRRTIRLEVAGAFHSPLMEPARARLEQAIDDTPFKPARFPVIANATAEPASDVDTLRKNLVRQLTAPVLFESSLRRALADGVESFFELSPGRVLCGLVKKISRKFPVESGTEA
ncbi:MAG: ACP S-malonyltransferase [Planctomycetota bacterium]|nr:ACP S-malonyltransferase [Planctomycetota bacterium]